MAVLAAPNEKLEAAKYFETCEKPQFDKAVILYEKAGYVGKAVDLAFETNQHNVLQFISSNFNESTEPLLLDKTASFFLQNEQYEKVFFYNLIIISWNCFDVLTMLHIVHIS